MSPMPEAATDAREAEAQPAILTITDEAAAKLDEQMEQDEGIEALRMLVQGGCCGMQYAMAMARREADAGERVVSSNGIDVYVDEEVVELLTGTTIDFEETVFGRGFTVSNPNVDQGGSCGCR